MRASLSLETSWRTYVKRLILVTYSHFGRRTLILCDVTLDPQMHRCVDRTKVMVILLLTYLHVLG